MAKSRNKSNYQSFQSSKGGRLAAIYFDMMDSKAWGELTGNDIKLYIYMLKKYTARYIKGILVESNKDDISIPKNEFLKFMGMSTFHKAIDHLIELGFVKVVKSRYEERKCTIYAFNDMWKYYKTNKFYIKNEWKRITNQSL